MALTITGTVQSTWSVRLVIDGGTPPYTVVAAPGGERPDYTVRTPYATVPGIPAQRIAVDGDIPLNTPTVYVVTDGTGAQAQTPPLTVTSTAPILADSTDPGRAQPVVVVSQPPDTWEARSVWWDVLGSQAPFASVAPMRFRNGDLVLRVEDRPARAALRDLLMTGNPLTLRATCPDAVDDVVMLVATATDELVTESDPSGPRLFTLTYQAISPDLGVTAIDPGRSYATVTAESATYAVLLSTYPSYDALRVGVPGGSLGAELVTSGDFSAGLGPFDTFWSTGGITWDTAAGTGRATAHGGGTEGAVIQSDTVVNVVTTPGTRYRIQGRVRSSHPATAVRVEAYTNTAPASPGYFQPGAAAQLVPLTVSATWSHFVVDVTIPAGDDRFAVYWRADNMLDTAVLEWDDLSVRSLT